jgi:hypothetical protein
MSTAKFDTLSNVAGTQTVPVATVAQGSAKAWVNFNGTGTVAILASFNVSSITDNGTGDYTVNFTNAMPDNNFAPFGNFISATGSGNTNTIVLGTRTTTSVIAFSVNSATGGLGDFGNLSVSVFR